MTVKAREREEKEKKQIHLKNEIKRKKPSQLFNSHSLHLSPLSNALKLALGR